MILKPYITIFLTTISFSFLHAEINNITDETQELVDVQSVRNVLTSFDPMEHTNGQIRLGYITSNDTSPRKSAYALGGHYDFATKRWEGIKLGLAAYSVLNLGISQNPSHVHSDFFNAQGNSYILLSEAHLDAHWGKTNIILGRQIVNTPHADGDDNRMMPNYFEAYTLTNTDIENVILNAGFITKMAGSGNNVDTSKFVNIHQTFDIQNQDDGSIYYASATYTGIKDLSLTFWYYHYKDIANVIYTEGGYTHTLQKDIELTFGIQYNQSAQSGVSLLGIQEARTYGLSAEAKFNQVGLTVLSAYNKDNGSGAVGLSLGGGPLFTSMEDQTLDVLGASGKVWMIGAGYAMEYVGVNGLTLGLAYAKFQAEDASVYSSNEINAIMEYTWNDKLTFVTVYASIDFDAGRDVNNNPLNDYQLFRLIGKYNF